jgi:hypothetical protein
MKARFILNFPVAVLRKRLAAPRFVLSFGMVSSEKSFPCSPRQSGVAPGNTVLSG